LLRKGECPLFVSESRNSLAGQRELLGKRGAVEATEHREALGRRKPLERSQAAQREARRLLVAWIGVAPPVEEPVPKPRPALRVEPAAAAGQETRKDQILRDVGLDFHLE